MTSAPARTVPLRDYQQQALDAILTAYERGVTRQLVSLPTGAGKTFLAAHLVRRVAATPDWRTVFMVHRDELATQSMRALQQINPDLRVGLVKAGNNDLSADMMVVSAQTLAREARLSQVVDALASRNTLFISDECFVRGTLIDGRPIEEVREGDLVRAFNEETKSIELRRVAGIMTRPAPATLYAVTVGGITTVATGNHPIYTPGGWRAASAIKAGDEVLVDVHGMRWAASRAASAATTAKDMLAGVQPGESRGADGGHEPQARIGTDEGAEPDARRRYAGAHGGDVANHRPPPAEARGQRHGHDGAATPAAVGARGWVGSGALGPHAHGARLGLPGGVQGGYRAPDSDGGRRSGRGITWLARPEATGREEGCAPAVARVERVEVLERGGDGRYERVCPDGLVYNFEVEGLHTYAANGIVVHNCHHDRADSRTRIIESIAPALLVGLTATPKRGDGQGLDRIYQEVVFHLPMLDLMRQGRLAPLKGVRVETGINLDDVRVRAGEFVEADLAGAVNTPDRNRIIVESWQKHASGRRRTVVFAVDVEHALAVRDAFREAGVTSEVVLGETGPEERAAILRDFHAGKIQVLSNCMVLTEGYDEPAIDCIIMARPTKSQGLYIQCVGRGARTSPEKEDCLVVDVADNTARHTLVAFLDLAGEEKQAGAKMPVGTPQGILDIVAEAEAIRVRREIEVDLFGRSPVLWHRRGTSESFFAPAASTEDANAWVTVIEYDGGFMPAIVTQSRARGAAPVVKHLFDRAVDIEIAKGIAEDAVEKSPLTRRDAAWRRRNDPPSDAQLRFARSLGARVPQGATKADVASLIDEQLFVRAMRKAGIA